jgi:hypothetical protein
MRAIALRPPTTPPTMGPMGVGADGGGVEVVGDGGGVEVVEDGGGVEVVEDGEVVVGELVDVLVSNGVRQICPVPAAQAQPSRL